MGKVCLFIFISILYFNSPAAAQIGKTDSLFVVIIAGRAMVIHEVKKDENLYSISQLYAVPAIVLSQNNDVSFYDQLKPGRKLMVPMGSYNYIKSNNSTAAKPIFYRTQSSDTYTFLAKSLEISESLLKSWNNVGEISGRSSQTITMGWIQYFPSEVQQATSNIKITNITTGISNINQVEDTAKEPPSDLEIIYNYQTSNGTFLDSLSGMIVFFKPQTTVNNKLLYAFSNEIGKGRILKVVNPSNQKFVFVKIIGPLPSTKQYINAKIGLDGRARAALETREIKLWCDFYFKY